MSKVDQSILDKIRKVAGYTQSSNANEAAVAAAKLTEMLLKYNLDRSEIPTEEQIDDPFTNERQAFGLRAVEWKIDLAVTIARANLCKVVISGPAITWLGRASNVEVARYIFDTVTADLERLADGMWRAVRAWAKTQPDIEMPHGKTFKQQFFDGANDAIRLRLSTETQRLIEAPKMNALIVVNTQELNEYTRTVFPFLTSRQAPVRNSGGGYTLGKAAGSAVQFKTGIGAGGSSAPKRIGGGN